MAGLDTALAVAGGATVILAALGAMWRFGSEVRQFNRRIEEFMSDWRGVPDRPGVPGRPGVMARLERIEHELTPNRGSSMKDAIGRVETKVDALQTPAE